MKRDGTIPVFAGLNFGMAFGAALVSFVFVAAAYDELAYTNSARDEKIETVLGCLLIGLVSLVAAFIYGGAGIGLLRRRPSGFFFHIMGAGMAALTCVGIVYSVIAIRFAARESFRNDFFAPAHLPGFAPLFTQPVEKPAGPCPPRAGIPTGTDTGGA